MAESELAGKETFDALSRLLRDIRKRAEQNNDRETYKDADKADVLLRDFGVAVGEQVVQLKNILVAYRELALKKADAALRGYQKANLELDNATVDAIAAIEVAFEAWP